MRKTTRFLSLLVLLMMAATSAWAQQTLTVYDGTFEDNTSPAYIGYSDEYTRSQTVIPSTALTAMKGCDITAMTFYCNGMPASGTIDYSFDVYLKEVSYTAFAESPTFEPKSSCTSVHQGKLSISNYTLTISFSKPFHYNGGNLLIGMENTSTVTYYQITFLGRDTGSSLSNISIHHKTDLASATSIAKRYYIPKTTFTYVVPTYTVNLNDGAENPTTWTAKAGDATTFGALPLEEVPVGETVTLKYDGNREVKSITAAVIEPEPEIIVTPDMPLTMEVIEAGTIKVNFSASTSNVCHGMKYSLDGGQNKTTITSTTTIDNLKAGDKVQFYGIGTSNTCYGDAPEVKITGGTATVKLYGNIMSLLNEEGFATAKTLSSVWTFYNLFNGNTKIKNARGLLLPATTLAINCYRSMFEGCTNLEAGPVLPAPTLVNSCYLSMFKNCSKLASVTCLATNISASACLTGWLDGAGTQAATSPKLYVVGSMTSASWNNANFTVTEAPSE